MEATASLAAEGCGEFLKVRATASFMSNRTCPKHRQTPPLHFPPRSPAADGATARICAATGTGRGNSPTLLAAQLVTLSRKTAPIARAWALAAGCAVVLAAFSVLALLVARSTGGCGRPSEAGAIVKLAAAVLLVVLGVCSLRRPPRQAEPVRTSPIRVAGHSSRAGPTLTNFSSIVLFFPAMHEIGIPTSHSAAKSPCSSCCM